MILRNLFFDCPEDDLVPHDAADHLRSPLGLPAHGHPAPEPKVLHTVRVEMIDDGYSRVIL